MAIAIVQKDPSGTSWLLAGPVTSATTVGMGSATTTGNRLIALATSYPGDPVAEPTFSDNGSHTWTNLGYSPESGSPSRFCSLLGYTNQITGRSDHEVTITAPATTYFVLGVFEVSGVDSSSPVADSDVGVGGGTSCSVNTLTLSGGTDLVLAVVSSDVGGTWTVTWSGATQEYTATTDDAERKLSSAATESPTWTKSESSNWVASGAAFRPAAAGTRKWLLGAH